MHTDARMQLTFLLVLNQEFMCISSTNSDLANNPDFVDSCWFNRGSIVFGRCCE